MIDDPFEPVDLPQVWNPTREEFEKAMREAPDDALRDYYAAFVDTDDAMQIDVTTAELRRRGLV